MLYGLAIAVWLLANPSTIVNKHMYGWSLWTVMVSSMRFTV